MLTLKAQLKHKTRPADDRLGKSEPAPVAIEYCVPGNHEPVARRLAEAIRREFGLAPRLIPSRGGAFEVLVDGRLVFSKRATWRFPDHDEIFYHVRNR